MILFPNTDITLYNKYYDIDNDCYMYQKTLIKNVDWQGKKAARVSNNISSATGTVPDDSYIIFIDKLDNYISPKAFLNLEKEERSKYFTFATGDKIVKGNIDFEYSTKNTLKKLEEDYDDVVTVMGVTSWSDHMEVECE